MPCPECGASVARGALDEHQCERERWLDYNLLQLRPELDAFDDQLVAYLQTPQGRFELWYAAHRRRTP
jgi:hypothetical protein